jgi:hypothetical protein
MDIIIAITELCLFIAMVIWLHNMSSNLYRIIKLLKRWEEERTGKTFEDREEAPGELFGKQLKVTK